MLLSLLSLLIFPAFAFLFEEWGNWIYRICYTATIFCAIYVATERIRDFTIGLILGGLTLVSYWSDIAINNTQALTIGSQLISFAFFIYISIHLTRSLSSQKETNFNVIIGAVVGYMLLGVIFGQMCAMMDFMTPGAFADEHNIHTRYEYFYYSFVTLTTVGYGDVVPNSDPARALAVLIALSGQIYLTIIMAILIGKMMSNQQKS